VRLVKDLVSGLKREAYFTNIVNSENNLGEKQKARRLLWKRMR
jgi:hypothetical protein